jgi:low affinity Fe/Cu permease
MRKYVGKLFLTNKDRTIHGHFGRFATVICGCFGSPWTFIGAGIIVLFWMIVGPRFNFSPLWNQLLNTVIMVPTFMMAFLILNNQNRDSKAINLKLNELIHANSTARNQLINIEDLSDSELSEMQKFYKHAPIKSTCSNRKNKSPVIIRRQTDY